MDIFDLFGYGVLVSVLLLLLLYFMLFIVPCLIISSAIKKIGKPTRFRIVKEYGDSFQLENDIFVYKEWYNDKYDLYECPYGYYMPVYTGINKDIVAFVYERKSR